MSTCCMNLEAIISNTPLDSQSRARLARLVSDARAEHRIYSFGHLVKEIEPASPEALALAMSALVENGLVERILRVESPSGRGGVQDFKTLDEIPDELGDWRTETRWRVRPEDIRVIYKF